MCSCLIFAFLLCDVTSDVIGILLGHRPFSPMTSDQTELIKKTKQILIIIIIMDGQEILNHLALSAG